jgi:hypothetical protein
MKSHPVSEGDLKTFLQDHPHIKVVGDFKGNPPKATGSHIPLEDEEQAEVCKWLEDEHPEIKFFSVPNGARTAWSTAKKLKATGLHSGVPDLVFPEPRGPYHGQFIEMKRLKGGAVSDSQRIWLEFLDGKGYSVTIAEGAEEAKRAILAYQALGITIKEIDEYRPSPERVP